jgi:CspA family cold shock protein
MPTGKVKWYDSDKGFGFLSRDEGEDVYVRADALPDGVTSLKAGARVEFGIVQGGRGDQALQVRLLDPVTSVSKSHSVGEGYRHGRHPDSKKAKPIAQVLRAVATELEL